MKKLLLFLPLIIACTAHAQKTVPAPKDSLPYQKYPKLPAFNILLQDSATIFNTYNIPEGRPAVLMFFSPDCDHCEKTTKALTEKMDSLKEVQFYLFTPMSLSLLRPFAERMKLGNYKNIVVGKEYESFFHRFYGANYVPCIALYDRKKQFVKMWEGSMKIEDFMLKVKEVLAERP